MGATMGQTKAHNMAFVEGSPVNVLLFGFGKKGNPSMTMTGGHGMSVNSNETNTGVYAHVVESLRFLIKKCTYTTFSIATTGPDGARLYSKEAIKSAGGL